MADAYYEKDREENPALHAQRGGAHTFPAHYHANLELLILGDGSYTVSHNGTIYRLGAGDLFFADHYDVHAYERTGESGDSCLLVLPSDCTRRFDEARKGRRTATPVSHDPALCRDLLTLFDRYFADARTPEERQAAVDLLLLRFARAFDFSGETVGDNPDPVHKMLAYIDAHYREKITLSAMAKRLGYSAEHLSREFHRYMHTSVPAYVAERRLLYAQEHRAAYRGNLALLAAEAGFGSLQSYYRVKSRKEKQSK